MNKESSFYEKVKNIKNKHEPLLMAKEGVIGCSVGYKEVDGKKTNRLAIICMVEKKRPRELLRKDEMLPKTIENVPIDVVEVGKIEKLKT